MTAPCGYQYIHAKDSWFKPGRSHKLAACCLLMGGWGEGEGGSAVTIHWEIRKQLKADLGKTTWRQLPVFHIQSTL